MGEETRGNWRGEGGKYVKRGEVRSGGGRRGKEE